MFAMRFTDVPVSGDAEEGGLRKESALKCALPPEKSRYCVIPCFQGSNPISFPIMIVLFVRRHNSGLFDIGCLRRT